VERSKEKVYNEYLKGRSLKGYIYKKWLLYPRIDRYLDGKLLDFGCGIGDFLEYRRNSVGVDSNQYNVTVCLQRGLDAKYIKSNRLPFLDRYFSSVVMDNVIEHIPSQDVKDVIQELLRVLIPGGTLLIGIPGPKGYASDDDHKCFYAESDLIQFMGKLGCINIRTLHSPFYFPAMGKYLCQYCIYVFFRAPFDA